GADLALAIGSIVAGFVRPAWGRARLRSAAVDVALVTVLDAIVAAGLRRVRGPRALAGRAFSTRAVTANFARLPTATERSRRTSAVEPGLATVANSVAGGRH